MKPKIAFWIKTFQNVPFVLKMAFTATHWDGGLREDLGGVFDFLLFLTPKPPFPSF
jgi:hypothetical protein